MLIAFVPSRRGVGVSGLLHDTQIKMGGRGGDVDSDSFFLPCFGRMVWAKEGRKRSEV